MHSRIIKTLGICDKEWTRTLAMSSLFFLLTLGWAFGRCSRDAFFIKTAGPDKLPYMYLITAGLMVVTSILYSRLVDTMARHRFFILQLLASSGLVLAVWVTIPLKYPFLPYALFSISEVISSIFFMHFWTFANGVFDPREGKRIFPLVGGMGLIGTVLGSVLATSVVSQIGTVNLLTVWLGTLVGSIPIVIWVHRAAHGSGITVHQSSSTDDKAKAETGFLESFHQVWRYPLIRTLTYMSIPMWLVSYFVDFQFFMAIDEVFSEQDQLTGFLGIFNSITFLSGFLLQMTVTRSLLRKFGVGSAVLAHPIGLTFGSLSLLARSFLPTTPAPRLFNFRALSGVFAKFSDNAIYFSISESASQLLYNAFPEEKRGQSRAFISGTVEPLCIALAGGILILFVMVKMPILLISALMVGFSLLWILFALRVKTDYLRALVENLSSGDLVFSSSTITQLNQLKGPQTTEVLLEAVSSPNENIAHFALELLQGMDDEKVAPSLCERLVNVRPTIQIAILSALTEIGTEAQIPAIRTLLGHTESDVRAAAIKAIGKLANPAQIEDLEVYLHDSALAVRTEALIALLRGKADLGQRRRAIHILKEMADDPNPAVRAKMAYAIGEVRIKSLLPMVLGLIASDDEWLQSEAVKAMGKLEDEQVIPPLIKLLDVDRLVQDAIAAIVNLGTIGLQTLHQDLEAVDTNPPIKIYLLECVKRLRSSQSIPILVKLLDTQPPRIGYPAIDALAGITEDAQIQRAQLSEKQMTIISQFLDGLVERLENAHQEILALQLFENQNAILLAIDALNSATEQLEETALKCLQLLTDPKTVRAAATNLRSPDLRTRAEAIELLEESGNEAKYLVKVLEARYCPGELDSATFVESQRIAATAVLGKLLDTDHSPWLLACVIHAVGELGLKEFHQSLWQRQDDSDPFVRYNAQLALQKLGFDADSTIKGEEVEKMEMNMERILFLRSVFLFSQVDAVDLRWINQITKEKRCSAGEIIFRENDEGDALYVIINGNVRVVKERDGQQVVLSILQEGDCFGEMAILEQQPRSATIEAQEDVRLLVISRDDFHRLLLARPKMAFALLRTLSQRLRQRGNQLSERIGISVRPGPLGRRELEDAMPL